ncbi:MULTISPECIES: hypothetical protein [unclassified Bradyrhizobium]|nr:MULTISPECIES: hypothetical protein [unclassified Bradyrhizobium]
MSKVDFDPAGITVLAIRCIQRRGHEQRQFLAAQVQGSGPSAFH